MPIMPPHIERVELHIRNVSERLAQEVQGMAAELYSRGALISDIAEELDIPVSDIYSILREAKLIPKEPELPYNANEEQMTAFYNSLYYPRGDLTPNQLLLRKMIDDYVLKVREGLRGNTPELAELHARRYLNLRYGITMSWALCQLILSVHGISIKFNVRQIQARQAVFADMIARHWDDVCAAWRERSDIHYITEKTGLDYDAVVSIMRLKGLLPRQSPLSMAVLDDDPRKNPGRLSGLGLDQIAEAVYTYAVYANKMGEDKATEAVREMLERRWGDKYSPEVIRRKVIYYGDVNRCGRGRVWDCNRERYLPKLLATKLGSNLLHDYHLAEDPTELIENTELRTGVSRIVLEAIIRDTVGDNGFPERPEELTPYQLNLLRGLHTHWNWQQGDKVPFSTLLEWITNRNYNYDTVMGILSFTRRAAVERPRQAPSLPQPATSHPKPMQIGPARVEPARAEQAAVQPAESRAEPRHIMGDEQGGMSAPDHPDTIKAVADATPRATPAPMHPEGAGAKPAEPSPRAASQDGNAQKPRRRTGGSIKPRGRIEPRKQWGSLNEVTTKLQELIQESLDNSYYITINDVRGKRDLLVGVIIDAMSPLIRMLDGTGYNHDTILGFLQTRLPTHVYPGLAAKLLEHIESMLGLGRDREQMCLVNRTISSK